MKTRAWVICFSFLSIAINVHIELAGASEPEDAHWARLRSMSVVDREKLSQKRSEFDALDPQEQASIRGMSAEIEHLSPQDQREAYSVIRRYFLWLQTLSEPERAEINSLPPEKRLAKIRSLRDVKKLVLPQFPVETFAMALHGESPYTMATEIETWFSLSPEKKAAVLKLKDPNRNRKLEELREQAQVEPVKRPTINRPEIIAESTKWRAIRDQYNVPALKWIDEDEASPKRARLLRHFGETRTFLEDSVVRVRDDRLASFTAAIPPWQRVLFDRLPPELSREHLTRLYRLIYPAPHEFQGTNISVAKVGSNNSGVTNPPKQPIEPANAKGKGKSQDLLPSKNGNATQPF